MPLKFECNQDPRKMKSVNGKKFCEHCQKHVYDMRRKSVEKTIALKKEKSACCVIIYDDQLQKAESVLSSESNATRRAPSVLPYAAGFAALSILPQGVYSQYDAVKSSTLPRIEVDEGGKKFVPADKANAETTAKSQVLPKKDAKKKTVVSGKVLSSYKKIGKSHDFVLGYYQKNDSGEVTFIKVKNFSSHLNGNFSFTLTEQELKFLSDNNYGINCGTHPVSYDDFDFKEPGGPLLITVRKRVRWVGKF